MILTGADGMFSAGYDIGEIPDETFAQQAERLVAHPFTSALEALEAYPYPTVAALSGHTIGGGLELALSCDLRVAAEGIRLGMPPAKLGLVYSHTGLRKFIDAVGAPRTRELFLLGRNIDTAKALAWGLVNDVVDADALAGAAVELAAELAGNAPALADREQARHPRAARRPGRAGSRGRARAHRAARGVLSNARHARGRARLRREAPAALARGSSAGSLRVAGQAGRTYTRPMALELVALVKHDCEVCDQLLPALDAAVSAGAPVRILSSPRAPRPTRRPRAWDCRRCRSWTRTSPCPSAWIPMPCPRWC